MIKPLTREQVLMALDKLLLTDREGLMHTDAALRQQLAEAQTEIANRAFSEEEYRKQLDAVTTERDDAVRIAIGLIAWAPITDADVKWAETKLAAQQHQEGLP